MKREDRKPKIVKLHVLPKSPDLVALNRIHRYYGHFFRPGPGKQVGKTVEYPIQGELPVEIKDEKRGLTRVAWLTFEDLGKIEVSKPTMKATAPSVSSIVKSASQSYRDTTDSIEADLVYAGQLQFGNLTYSKVLLQPLAKIVGLLQESPDGLTLERIQRAIGDSRKAERHTGYLVESGYATVQSGRTELVVPTRKFIVARRELADPTEFISSMVGIVLATQYSTVTQDAPMVKAYVRAGMAFYRPAADYGQLIGISYPAVVENYKRMYSPNQKILDSFTQIYLRDLESHEILHVEDDVVTGNQRIFGTFLERAAPKISMVSRSPIAEIGGRA